MAVLCFEKSPARVELAEERGPIASLPQTVREEHFPLRQVIVEL